MQGTIPAPRLRLSSILQDWAGRNGQHLQASTFKTSSTDRTLARRGKMFWNAKRCSSASRPEQVFGDNEREAQATPLAQCRFDPRVGRDSSEDDGVDVTSPQLLLKRRSSERAPMTFRITELIVVAISGLAGTVVMTQFQNTWNKISKDIKKSRSEAEAFPACVDLFCLFRP